MEVKLAKSAGFCFGVKRAVETVYEQIEKQKEAERKLPIYTYGPIIHNEQVVKDLEEKGVQVLENREELETLQEGIVVIRSHGIGKDICELIEKKRAYLRRCHLSFCEKDPQYCGKRKRKREADPDYRKSRTPGSRRNQRLVQHVGCDSGIGRRDAESDDRNRKRDLRCFPDDI